MNNNNGVVLNYFNYPLFLVGGVVIVNFSFFLKVDLWGVLAFVFLWFVVVLLFCFKGVKVLWLDKGGICFRRKLKVVSFDRGVVEISVKNCVFKPIEIVVNMPGRREVFLLPGFIPEEQREFVIKMIERFCLEHNITYL